MNANQITVTIKVSEEDYFRMLYLLGWATGASLRDKDKPQAEKFKALFDTITASAQWDIEEKNP